MHKIGGSIAIGLAIISLGIHISALNGENPAADSPLVWGLFGTGLFFVLWMLKRIAADGWRTGDALALLPRWGRGLTWALAIYLGLNVLLLGYERLDSAMPERISGRYRVLTISDGGHMTLVDEDQSSLGFLEGLMDPVEVENLPVTMSGHNGLVTMYEQISESEYDRRHAASLRMSAAGWTLMHAMPGIYLVFGSRAKKKKREPLVLMPVFQQTGKNFPVE